VLVVIDTLRADRLGCYGYVEQPTSPAMDRLASEGILFESFRAASPWTGASFGSILTGVSPTVHGAGERARKGARGARSILGVSTTALNRKVPTLAELLDDVPSAAIVTNSFLHRSMGFARGFDHYDFRHGRLSGARRADAVTRAAVEWLEENREGPGFLMVHYFDPHISYDPPVKYLKDFASMPSGRFEAPFSEHSAARKGTLKPSDEEKAFIRGLYNGEVRFVDDQIGEIVKAMGRLEMLDDTWIAITADHGEEQFDHGSFDHGHRYEDEVIRVPLIIRPPGGKWRAGTRVPYSTRHVDLAPTILEWFGRKVPDHMGGASLAPLISGEEKRHRPAYMEFNIYWASRHALFDGRYKLLRSTEEESGWMYDLETDPAEKRRLKKDHPEYARMDRQLAAVKDRLDKIAASVVDGTQPIEIDPEMAKALRSLGYIE
jgi:arylsulfatase A-like enzyme